jgi:hypothetical protein
MEFGIAKQCSSTRKEAVRASTVHIKTRWWEDGLVISVVDCEQDETGMDHIASASTT